MVPVGEFGTTRPQPPSLPQPIRRPIHSPLPPHPPSPGPFAQYTQSTPTIDNTRDTPVIRLHTGRNETPPILLHPPTVNSMTDEKRRKMEDDDDAGCCKCVVMWSFFLGTYSYLLGFWTSNLILMGGERTPINWTRIQTETRPLLSHYPKTSPNHPTQHRSFFILSNISVIWFESLLFLLGLTSHLLLNHIYILLWFTRCTTIKSMFSFQGNFVRWKTRDTRFFFLKQVQWRHRLTLQKTWNNSGSDYEGNRRDNRL